MRSTTLGEIIKLEYGKPLPQSERDENGSYPAYGANGVKTRTNKYFYDKPSIVVGRKGSAGEINLVDSKFWPLDVTYFLTHDERITDLLYLYHLLKTLNLPSMARGVKPGINRNDIYAIKVNIPSLDEQKQIVKKLSVAFEKIDQAIELNEKNITYSKNIFRATLRGYFDQEHQDWTSEVLGSITTKIGSGATPKGGKNSYRDVGTSLIRSLNVYDTYFKYDKLAHLSQEQADKLSNVTLERKDILINITGASVARCSIVPEDCLPGRVNQHVSIIRVDQTKVLPEFLHYQLISDRYKKLLLGIGDENGSTRQAITKGHLQKFMLHFPTPLSQQAQIVDAIDKILDFSHLLIGKYTQKSGHLRALKQSMLNEAFLESPVK